MDFEKAKQSFEKFVETEQQDGDDPVDFEEVMKIYRMVKSTRKQNPGAETADAQQAVLQNLVGSANKDIGIVSDKASPVEVDNPRRRRRQSDADSGEPPAKRQRKLKDSSIDEFSSSSSLSASMDLRDSQDDEMDSDNEADRSLELPVNIAQISSAEDKKDFNILGDEPSLNTAISKLAAATQLLQQVVEETNLIRRGSKHYGEEHSELIFKAERVQEDLREILSLALLSPPQLHQLHSIQQELRTNIPQLKLYQLESHIPQCAFALVIMQQPFPTSIKQHSKSTSAILVRLLTGTKATVRPISPVTAQLYEVAQPRTLSNRSFAIGNSKQQMDDTNTARFQNLRFTQGTRLKMACLQFSVEVEFTQGASTGKTVIRSDNSEPFIVFTNESQWAASEGNLLRNAAFAGKTEVPWYLFANTLQYHYIRATRQECAAPRRPLSIEDIEYIHAKFFPGKSVITIDALTNFWNWFGKVLKKVRYQKPFAPLWRLGLAYGFLSKEGAEKLLQNQPPGTFLIRFSETKPGKVAIAYTKSFVSDDEDEENANGSRHSIESGGLAIVETTFNPSGSDASSSSSSPAATSVLEGADANGSTVVDASSTTDSTGAGERIRVMHFLYDDSEDSKTLPDFLRDCGNLKFVLGLRLDEAYNAGSATVRTPKSQALQSFYTKQERGAVHGYEPAIY